MSPAGARELRFLSWNPDRPEVWNGIIEEYERRSGTRIHMERAPSSSSALHDLLVQKLRNESPDIDVFFMDVIWVPEFAAAGWASPLEDVFPPTEREKFLPGTIAANTYGKVVYGIPLFVDAGMLYYRKDLLEEYGFSPPETWQEMVHQADTVVRGEAAQGNRIYGFSAQFKQYEGLLCVMQEFILSNGGAIMDPETGAPRFTDPAALEAVRYVRDECIGGAAPRGALTYEEPESMALFVQGRAVFHRNWPYVWSIAGDRTASRIAGRVGIARLPRFPGGRSCSTLGGWQLGISSFSRRRGEAARFILYLTGDEVQRRFAVETGRAPSRRALYGDRSVLAANPQFRDMKDVFLRAVPRPRTPLYPAVSNALQRYLSRVLAFPDTDIAAEAATARRRIEWIQSLLPQGEGHAVP
ncbi:MAG: ABC transporter substrate-binding protein [Spirochaetes bacterium]|nr:ABC transporter substrate-binding protein [Spirochaetota bacterium]